METFITNVWEDTSSVYVKRTTFEICFQRKILHTENKFIVIMGWNCKESWCYWFTWLPSIFVISDYTSVFISKAYKLIWGDNTMRWPSNTCNLSEHSNIFLAVWRSLYHFRFLQSMSGFHQRNKKRGSKLIHLSGTLWNKEFAKNWIFNVFIIGVRSIEVLFPTYLQYSFWEILLPCNTYCFNE